MAEAFILGWFPSTQALRHGAWWLSSLQPGGTLRERQSVLVLELAPPFNNFQRLFHLILHGGTFVFLLAGCGSGGEEALEVLRL
jgi:hypothetical protein